MAFISARGLRGLPFAFSGAGVLHALLRVPAGLGALRQAPFKVPGIVQRFFGEKLLGALSLDFRGGIGIAGCRFRTTAPHLIPEEAAGTGEETEQTYFLVEDVFQHRN